MTLDNGNIKVIGELKNTYKCIVPISGGKDSQACLTLAKKQFKKTEILGLFCDTGYEHQITYDHVKKITEQDGINLITLSAGTVLKVCTKYKRFPGGGARHCTYELKIRPCKIFYEWLAKKQGGFEVWYGMRSYESQERAKRYKGKLSNESYPPHEVMMKYPKKLHKLGVTFKLPIIDWAKDEVFTLLDGKENPLYSHGFDRVGCFPCLAGGEGFQMMAFYFDDTGLRHYKIAQEISKISGREVFQTKRYKNQGPDDPGCLICSI